MLPEEFIPDIEALGKRFNEPKLLAQVTEAVQLNIATPIYQKNTLIILRPLIDDFDRLGVLVWVGINKRRGGFGESFHLVLSMAKATGMAFIRFETKRKGFAKLGARYGFERIGQRGDYTIYQQEVT